MSEQAPTKSRSAWRDVADQFADHVDLATVELRYETENAGKKIIVLGAVFVLVLTGFLVLQVALIGGLMKAGLSLSLSAALFGGLYFLTAFGVYLRWGRRDRRAGLPFARTQNELRETIKWIQSILS